MSYTSKTYKTILLVFLFAAPGRTLYHCTTTERTHMNCEAKVKPYLRFYFLSEHHAMKACWRSGFIAPQIPDLGARWR